MTDERSNHSVCGWRGTVLTGPCVNSISALQLAFWKQQYRGFTALLLVYRISGLQKLLLCSEAILHGFPELFSCIDVHQCDRTSH